jgi:hypothetical protein
MAESLLYETDDSGNDPELEPLLRELETVPPKCWYEMFLLGSVHPKSLVRFFEVARSVGQMSMRPVAPNPV